MSSRIWAEELARRNFVVLNVSAYGAGTSAQPDYDENDQGIEGLDGNLTPMGLLDAKAFLSSLSFVDSTRIGMAGHSMGSRRTGYALVPARVVAMGPAQSFSRTVTIDAGTSSGVRADRTVVDSDGLVGRVVRADRHTATVLLLVDQESVVGGRLGSSMEVGFLRGRGQVGGDARLDLELLDSTASAARGDSLSTWGSKNGAPYVAGIPIGRVKAVYTTPRQQSTRAVITPYVDFTALDLVGVVVDRRTRSDRTTIKAGAPVAADGGPR